MDRGFRNVGVWRLGSPQCSSSATSEPDPAAPNTLSEEVILDMMKCHQKRNLKNDNRGFISADFIFSLVLAAGVSIVLFALTFTFSVAEIAQYVVFSASRAYVAANVDSTKQEELGNSKFDELINNKELAPMLKSVGGHWFVLNNLDLRGGGEGGKTFNDEYAGYEERIPFVGARADFEAKLLSLRIPFLGNTDDEGNGFKAKLTAFLIREPNQKECWDLQIKKRYSSIMDLDNGRYKGSGTTNASSGINDYVPMEDNGC